MHLKGKQRLFLVAAAVVAVIVAFTLINSRNSSGQHPAAVAPTATGTAGPLVLTTATPLELSTIRSWNLTPGDMPAGTVLFNTTEIPLSAVAQNDPKAERQLEAEGFVTAYQQQWRQTDAQFQFADETDLYQTAAEARTHMMAKPQLPATSVVQELPDPKIGDASRMYGVTTNPAGGPQQQAFVVAWVRGRALLFVTSASPPGALTSDQIVALAKAKDKLAAAKPLQ